MDTQNMKSQLELFRQGLSLGQVLTTGTDRYRIETAQQRLRNLVTGQFASLDKVLDADVQKRLMERQAILKDLASQFSVLLSKNVKDLTETQYQTLRQLAAIGHPYAKRHFQDARGRFNPRLKKGRAGIPTPGNAINYQGSGAEALRDSFQYEVVQKPGGLWAVLATSPLHYAGLLAEGTNVLIGRAYDAQAAALAQQQISGAVAEASARLEAIGEKMNLKAPEIDFQLGGATKAHDYKV